MKVTVGIPSRGRPLDLAAAVLALEKMKSRGHEVCYLVACDKDDEATLAVARELNQKRGIPVFPQIWERPLGLGELHNKMANLTASDSVFMLWSDRLVPADLQWDHAVVMATLQFPNRVLWMDSHHLTGAGQFILPPKWRARYVVAVPCPGLSSFRFEDLSRRKRCRIPSSAWVFPRM